MDGAGQAGGGENHCRRESHAMKHFLLFYEVVENYAERRVPFRKLHLQHALDAKARGELVLAGALADSADGGVLMVHGETAAAAQAVARKHPHLKKDLVSTWRVGRGGAPVKGAGAPVNR